jgi:hypothetical protein
VGVCFLQASSVSDVRDGSAQDEDAADGLVLGSLPDDYG